LAAQILPQFQEHPDAWQRVPAILQQSSSSQTKVITKLDSMSAVLIAIADELSSFFLYSPQYIALQILDKLIATRWKVLPQDQQQGEKRGND
jgi:exportin-1